MSTYESPLGLPLTVGLPGVDASEFEDEDGEIDE